jgi:hypothetical protein
MGTVAELLGPTTSGTGGSVLAGAGGSSGSVSASGYSTVVVDIDGDGPDNYFSETDPKATPADPAIGRDVR